MSISRFPAAEPAETLMKLMPCFSISLRKGNGLREIFRHVLGAGGAECSREPFVGRDARADEKSRIGNHLPHASERLAEKARAVFPAPSVLVRARVCRVEEIVTDEAVRLLEIHPVGPDLPRAARR